jgi:hypothetical protein
VWWWWHTYFTVTVQRSALADAIEPLSSGVLNALFQASVAICQEAAAAARSVNIGVWQLLLAHTTACRASSAAASGFLFVAASCQQLHVFAVALSTCNFKVSRLQ